MEVNLNSIQSASPATNNNASGVSAPQTDAQKADYEAQRVSAPAESYNLENKAAQADDNRFQAVRSKSAHYAQGANPVLNDIKFTIYGAQKNVPVASKFNEYVVRFTDIKTGEIQVKSEPELFHGTSGGDVVSGQV